MDIPTSVRLMNPQERELVDRVFGNTLPNRYRIILTNGLGGGGAPFTIPTSLINLATLPAAFGAALDGLVMNLPGSGTLTPTTQTANSWGIGLTPPTIGARWQSQVMGLINLGFFMNIGRRHYGDMTASSHGRELLVHETAHVWQGQNSWSATTYALNSITHQCAGMISGNSRNAAYNYTPGQPFSEYNTEQQASIVEDWYKAGEPTSGPLWPYIQNHVRTGNP